jgi:hypothetical protein
VKVWVTKFWEKKGIYQANAKSFSSSGKSFTMQYGTWTRVNPIPLTLGKTAFTSEEGAKARVRELRLKKIAVLRERIAQLEKMKP